MRALVFAAILTACFAGPAVAQQTPSQQQAARYSTAETPIGELLANPAARAIIAKHAPRITSSSQIDAVAPMPLKALQGYAPQELSDEVLAKIDVELAKVPVK